MTHVRRAVGATGERLAAAYLSQQGLRIIESNVDVGGSGIGGSAVYGAGIARGEIDLVAMHGPRRVAVEVRTITGEGDPMQALGASKVERVGRLGRLLGAERVDLVAIRLGHEGAEVRWVMGAG